MRDMLMRERLPQTITDLDTPSDSQASIINGHRPYDDGDALAGLSRVSAIRIATAVTRPTIVASPG
jgi:hypothetical protein